MFRTMIFSRKNAGKWVVSKGDRVIASGTKLPALMKKVESRKDKDSLQYDRVPKHQFFAGICGVSVR